VNACGNTSAERLAAVEHRVDEVAVHGARLGTTLGLAVMATLTDVDYSTRPRGFRGGAPEDIDEIELILERLDGHGDAIAEINFCILYLPCDDFLCILHLRIIFSLNAFEAILSRTCENNCPLAQNPQQIPIRQSINPVQKKTLRTWEKPYRLVFQQCVLASHHSQCTPSVNKIAYWDALQIHLRTHPSLLISSPVLRGENPHAMDKGKQPQEGSSSKKRTIRK
jgi:hypothetical protein